MKKIAVVFLTSVFSLSLALPAFAGSSTLSLEVDSSSYATSDAVPVVVNVNPNGASLDTVRIELSFNPSYLYANSYALGDLFTYPSPSYEIDNTNGVISFGGYKFGDVVTESGAVATVYFTAVAEGETSITVSSDSKLISDGEEQFDTSDLDTLSISLTGEAVEVVEEVVEEETSYSDATLEAEALVYFGAFYARMPSNATDWEALHCIAYGGCQGDPRDVDAEAAALELFGQKYAKMPETSMEWNVLHTIAYTDLLTYDSQSSDDATEETSSSETEMTLEEQAIGWFGTLAGYLPSSDADWLAIEYMVHGYFPEARDLDAEVSAINRFTQAFGHEPSSHEDWNVVSAIAYSGAF